jgi:putative hemolysin
MKYIDLEKILRTSYPHTANRLPVFVFRILEKIIMQNSMNEILAKYENEIGLDFLKKITEEFNIEIIINGLENLPENPRCIFASNHPFGIVDGLVITKIVSEKYGHLKAIGNDAFLLIPQLHSLIAQVNVFGKNSKQSVLMLEELYKSNIPITTFPAGEVSRVFKGKIQDNEWKKSFVSKAIENQRDIVPVRFSGRNSGLFYSIFLFRKIFLIKANIELILLPREMFRKRNKKIEVTFGKPISYIDLKQAKSHSERVLEIRKTVYNLNH